MLGMSLFHIFPISVRHTSRGW